MWGNERAISIDRADAVAVTIGAKSGVIFSRSHGLPRGLDMRLDRLRMNASKPGGPGASNFVRCDSVAPEQLAEQPRGGAVHRVDHKAKLCFAQALPID